MLDNVSLYPLKQIPNWVSYKIEWDAQRERKRKIPLNPHDGTNAKANDPATWGTYEEAMTYAIECARKQGTSFGQYFGVGFEFGGSGYAGIDLDHVVKSDGTLKDFAREIVDMVNSYTEYSPSGTGLHILFRLDRPLSELCTRNRNDEIGLEIYDSGRYFTVTGNVYGELKPIAERAEALKEVCKKYMKQKKGKASLNQPVNTASSNLTDGELLDKMFHSEHGRKIKALYSGDTSGYDGDASRADEALCFYLAYWTNNDADRMDSLFRQSGLYRAEKWDSVRVKGQTYGEATIHEAIKAVPEWTPTLKRRQNDSFTVHARQTDSPKPEPQKIESEKKSELIIIQDYLSKTLESDLERFNRFANRKTGFSNLDERMSLYPGLYVLGGVSSVGKTAFCVQLADQLAQAGEHVMYFPLEATPLEIVSRGIARRTAQEDFLTAVSSINIRAGRITDSVRRAIGEYKLFSSHEVIAPCSFRTTANEVIATVEEYIKTTGQRPVVIVDYLQLLRPSDPKLTTREAVEQHVQAFKLLQLEHDLVIFLVSSLNRQNYLTTIDFESFKESGGIEYTADVVLGLQLHCMNNKIFDEDKKLVSKREVVKEAKRREPRQVELVILKSRFGIASETYHFDYYAKHDLYQPVNTREDTEDFFETKKVRRTI